MVAFCTVLIAPLQTLYNDFNQYRKRMKIKAGGSPQVCMLQKIVKDSLDIDLIISEGNGKPVDFIIHTSFTDVDKERQLFALIDRYKLAGKRYEYKNAALYIESHWDEYVCEQQTAFIAWREYLCEEKYRPVYYIRCLFDGQYVHVELEKPLASDMNIRIYRYDVDLQTGGTINWHEVIFKFKKGDSGIYQANFPYRYHVMTNIALSKTEDEEYIYKYDVI